MKLHDHLLLATALNLIASAPGFSMEQEELPTNNTLTVQQPSTQQAFDPVEFVRSFVPKDSSEDYIPKVANCYRDALSYKKEIMHDIRPVLFGQSAILPNTVVEDYGWTFPPVPRVQRHLLEFCAQAEDPVNMMDIGAGYGIDSMFALLTKNVQNLYALEKQKKQKELLERVVRDSIQTYVDPHFPLTGFKAFTKDFLTLAPDFSKGMFQVLNANKVIHFFDPNQTKIFGERATSLLKLGGRLFLTCLTPSPGSEIETFMNAHEAEDFPGYVFYTQETKLKKIQGKTIPGESRMLEVRKPKQTEKSAHFCQREFKGKVQTDRVMHYHTATTLAKVLGDEFTIVETMITTPEENNGTDHMVSIVAEKIAKKGQVAEN
ncbi:MAG: hypothetical protein HYX35_02395 [Proteobacteria bacterium]|nr:hypothetical protein [Pseudomonadota bacterium]